jgi:rSAM/selenodomain-associated transferase 2
MISVIVPTCNEEERLSGCLESVTGQGRPCQLIISDGGSKDGTLRIACRYTNQIITREIADLPAQLNAGAAVADGDILLFLHADSRLAPGMLERLENIPRQVQGGSFSMQLDGNRLFYRLISLGGNLYCRLTRTYFGDRGIYARAAAFREIGGFNQLPIMSDLDFSDRLKRYGRTAILKGPLISSSRKFDRENPWLTLYLIFYALLAFRLGADPEKIREKYYST